MKKAVLFDLDGTVLASQKGIFHSISYSLSKLSLPIPSEDDLIAFLGPPLTEGFANVCHVPKPLILDAVKYYREYYNAGGMLEAEIFDGIPQLLIALRNYGIACYITTSKPQVYAKQILSHFKINSLFDGIYGSELDGTRVRKSEVIEYCLTEQCLQTKDVVLVGDRCYDAVGAREVGVDCIGVTYGYGSEEELHNEGLTLISENTRDLESIILSL